MRETKKQYIRADAKSRWIKVIIVLGDNAYRTANSKEGDNHGPQPVVPQATASSPVGGRWLAWLVHALRLCVNEQRAIHKVGIDAYLSLRFVRTIILILVPLSLVVLSILLPLGITANGNSSITGLDRLSWSNLHDKGWKYLLFLWMILPGLQEEKGATGQGSSRGPQ